MNCLFISMKYVVFLFFITITGSTVLAQKTVTFDQLAPRLTTQNDTVYVVNFWATWCAPCVAELPFFERLSQTWGDQKVKVLLVSLDYKTQVESKVIPFLEKKNITVETLVLTEKDPNKWVGKVDENWTGSIPATLVFSKTKRAFFEQEFETYEDIETILKSFF